MSKKTETKDGKVVHEVNLFERVDLKNLMKTASELAMEEDASGGIGTRIGFMVAEGILEKIANRAIELEDDELLYYAFNLGLFEKTEESEKAYEEIKQRIKQKRRNG